MALDFSYIVTGFLGLLFLAVFYYKRRQNYWKNKGVFQLDPEQIDHTLPSPIKILKNYKLYKSKGLKYAGEYELTQPKFVPIDPALIKQILQTDFYHFTSHGVYNNEVHDPLSANLFNMEGAEWKNMRAKLTPTFTSGKMKMMFQTFVDITVELKDALDVEAKAGRPVEIKDLMAKFTTDIIGSCAFGLECNSLKDPEAEFRRYGRKAFVYDKVFVAKHMLARFVPMWFLKLIQLKVTNQEIEDFFLNAVRQTIKYREDNNIYRKDFMHLLIQLKNLGKVTDDGTIKTDKKAESALSFNQLAAQAYLFFLAGFETSSTTMTFALYELCSNLDVQEKLRKEIVETLAKHKTMSYDAVMEMQYLDRVLQETLRKHPPLPNLIRVCTKDWTIPETNIKIEKGTGVVIPAVGLHMDPEYFPDPEKFEPDRFLEENKAKRPAFTWMPFGDGPRLCIGLRFGLLQSKVGLITLLKNFRVTFNEKTIVPLKYERRSFISSPEGGIWLNLEKIN